MSEVVACCICGMKLDRATAIHSERTGRWFCPVKRWQACENRVLKKSEKKARVA